MANIVFQVDSALLTAPRSLDLRPNKKYGIPDTACFRPLNRFLQDCKLYTSGQYVFRMYKLLHVAAIKMLSGRLKPQDFRSAFFAAGGLYLALDQQHKSLAFNRTFGDFTSGFSHQFGVALATMIASEAFGAAWDRVVPIPVGRSKVLDYNIPLRNGGWLQLEAKGTVSSTAVSSMRTSIAGKKKASKTTAASNTGFLGVIVQAARRSDQIGAIELLDPEPQTNPPSRQPHYQLAGRLLHYAALAEFAGADNVAQALRQRANEVAISQIVDNGYEVVHFEPRREPLQRMGRQLVAAQWRFGDGLAGEEVLWLYQGIDLTVINQVLAGEMPEVRHFSSAAPDTELYPASDRQHTHLADSILPDGSYLGLGTAPLPEVPIASQSEPWGPDALGEVVRR